MDWNLVSLDSYRSAQSLRPDRHRSCVSRAYYAAHAAVSNVLLQSGYTPPEGRTTPPHRDIPELIGNHLGRLGQGKVRELRASIRRLYRARIEADYVNMATINAPIALAAVRDAASVLRALEVDHDHN